jgi:hypothetical protein
MGDKNKIIVNFKKSTNSQKKYMVTVYKPDGTKKTIHFGAAGSSDYTKHKDPERKQRYISRHRSRENWTKSGVTTAGFWSRWVLWNEPTIAKSLNSTSKKFGIVIKRNNK